MSSVRSAKRSVTAKLPPTIREQYFSVLAKPEPEMVHPDLYKMIIDDCTDVILNEVKRYNDTRKQLIKEIRDRLSVRAQLVQTLAVGFLYIGNNEHLIVNPERKRKIGNSVQ